MFKYLLIERSYECVYVCIQKLPNLNSHRKACDRQHLSVSEYLHIKNLNVNHCYTFGTWFATVVILGVTNEHINSNVEMIS